MSYIGVGAVLLFLYRRNAELQLNLRMLMEYLIVCVVFALVGARILFVLALIPSMEQVTLNELLNQLLNGGIVFYGGLFGVICGVIVVSKYKHRNGKEILNIVAPAFPLFHAFARIGCLLSGCCYGVEWNWGVIMVDEQNIIRFPVQLVESICNGLIFMGLMYLEYKVKTKRYNMAFYLCFYAICRFILEFYRGDSIRGMWWGGFSTAQYISMLIIFVYVCCFIKCLCLSGFKKKSHGLSQ